ncbi:TRAP transporter substrate-binding protein [Desulfogranum marinum]|uniref:TRAP transporter substrate-binding protein n=1 Tax=Desulfogranum marinum TaxID=453220 RepID=UPI001962F987|nr:TRAP transporter substrate-binding protein DctP [Desulfogranum marinum]MBM9514028.1 TRAP transporter substrate-binding protein DctP [Desulfogranum marinum]
MIITRHGNLVSYNKRSNTPLKSSCLGLFSMKWLAALLLLSMVVGTACTNARAAAITLTFATNTAPVGLRGQAEKAFIDEVEHLSQGKIRITSFWKQSYLRDQELLEGIKDGSVDMGHVNINYYPKRLVVNSVMSLLQQGPYHYANRIWAYDTIYNKIPQLNAEFTKFNQKIIYTYSPLPMEGVFTRPVTSLTDFQNLRVYTPRRWIMKILEEVGAVPISIPWTDTFMALKTNAIEGVYTNIDAIHRVGLDSVAPNILIFQPFWIPLPFHITINLDTWNQLPQDIQLIIRTASTNSKRHFAAHYENMLDEIVAAQREAGCQVAFVQKEDMDTWLKLPEITKVEQLWIKEVSQFMPTEEAWGILEKIESIVSEGIRKDSRPKYTHPEINCP